jgi:hypothetical protein
MDLSWLYMLRSDYFSNFSKFSIVFAQLRVGFHMFETLTNVQYHLLGYDLNDEPKSDT